MNSKEANSDNLGFYSANIPNLEDDCASTGDIPNWAILVIVSSCLALIVGWSMWLIEQSRYCSEDDWHVYTSGRQRELTQVVHQNNQRLSPEDRKQYILAYFRQSRHEMVRAARALV